MGADQNFDWTDYAASTLDWWQAAGVDASIDEQPRNWLKPLPPPNRTDAATADAPRKAAAAVAAAQPERVLPDTIEAFASWRTGVAAPEAGWPGAAIAAQGTAGAALMVLIDQPEREDAETGMLLSGPAGRLFDRMLAAIGQDRSSIYLAAVSAKRPLAGRIAPEIEADLHALARHHLSLAAPRMLLLLGNAPSRALLGADAARMRGGLHRVNSNPGTPTQTDVQAVASFHPRFLLERPAAKAEAWKDLQMLIGGLRREG